MGESIFTEAIWFQHRRVMTTPHERFRALAHFIELLDVAVKDEHLPTELRHAAASLRHTFPQAQELTRLVESGRQGLPSAMADSLQQAVIWLNALGR
jgi:hypothetical protein